MSFTARSNAFDLKGDNLNIQLQKPGDGKSISECYIAYPFLEEPARSELICKYLMENKVEEIASNLMKMKRLIPENIQLYLYIYKIFSLRYLRQLNLKETV
jgi:hypothetical protein